MPFSQSAAQWTVGIAKQVSGENTIPTLAEYDMPVFSGTPTPVKETDVVSVTDASSIAPDSYAKAGIHWESTVEVPAYADVIGRVLQGIHTTDTKTGVAPSVSHVFSNMGASPPWVTMYSSAPSLGSTFEAGVISGYHISATSEGGPAHFTFSAVGKRPTVAAYTVTTNVQLSSGWFTAQGAVLKYDEDTSTAATKTNIQSFDLGVERAVTPVPTADGISVSNLGLGLVNSTIEMSLLWTDWLAYRNYFYGADAGTTPSQTLPRGSVELNFVHNVQATWSLKFVIPAVLHIAEQPTPDPSAPPLTVTVHGDIQKPVSGDPVQPTLINSVSTQY